MGTFGAPSVSVSLHRPTSCVLNQIEMGCGVSQAEISTVHVARPAAQRPLPFGSSDAREEQSGSFAWESLDTVGGYTWTPFSEDNTRRLEQAFAAAATDCAVLVDGRLYSVDLKRLVQRGGGSERSVRRRRKEEAPVQEGPPTTSHSTADADGLMLVPRYEVKRAHEGGTYAAQFSPDGNTFCCGGRDCAISFRETSSGALLGRCALDHEGFVLAIRYASDRPLLATGCEDSGVRLFPLANSYLPGSYDTSGAVTLGQHLSKVYGLDFCRDSNTLLSGSVDGAVVVWDVAKQQVTQTITHHGDEAVYAIRAAPQSRKLFVTACDDSTMAMFDLRTGPRAIRVFRGHTQTLWGCDFRFDELQLASCGMDGDILLWDPRNEDAGPLRRIPNAHSAAIHNVEYMPDGNRLLSCGRDRAIKLWSIAATGVTATTVADAHPSHVFGVTFSSLAGMVLSVSLSADAKMWGVEQKGNPHPTTL